MCFHARLVGDGIGGASDDGQPRTRKTNATRPVEQVEGHAASPQNYPVRRTLRARGPAAHHSNALGKPERDHRNLGTRATLEHALQHGIQIPDLVVYLRAAGLARHPRSPDLVAVGMRSAAASYVKTGQSLRSYDDSCAVVNAAESANEPRRELAVPMAYQPQLGRLGNPHAAHHVP